MDQKTVNKIKSTLKLKKTVWKGYALPRNSEIILLRLAEGKTVPQIAVELYLSFRTIERHLIQLRALLGARTQAQCVVRAIQEGIIDFPEQK